MRSEAKKNFAPLGEANRKKFASLRPPFALGENRLENLHLWYESDEKMATIAYLDEISDSESHVGIRSETEKDQELNQSTKTKERGK